MTKYDSWISGIKDELSFWNKWFKYKGKLDNNENDFSWEYEERIKPVSERKFEYDYLIPNNANVLDVGSGCIPLYGTKSDKLKELICSDALAIGYNIILQYYGITDRSIKFAMTEYLNSKFSAGQFDLVICKNTLDHQFNPLNSILNMLYVCKPNGKVKLIHNINEAENENYKGFHQWNICVKQDGIHIWNKTTDYNISDYLINSNLADVIIDKSKTNYQLEFTLINKGAKVNSLIHIPDERDILIEALISDKVKQETISILNSN